MDGNNNVAIQQWPYLKQNRAFFSKVVHSVHGIMFKDLKQILRKEQCDASILLTANVPSAKKIIVHGPQGIIMNEWCFEISSISRCFNSFILFYQILTLVAYHRNFPSKKIPSSAKFCVKLWISLALMITDIRNIFWWTTRHVSAVKIFIYLPFNNT